MEKKDDQFVMIPYELFDLVEEGLLSLREFHLDGILKQYNPCYPSMQRLEEGLRVDRRTIIRCMGSLRYHGIVKRYKGNSNGYANRYVILPPDQWNIQRIEND